MKPKTGVFKAFANPARHTLHAATSNALISVVNSIAGHTVFPTPVPPLKIPHVCVDAAPAALTSKEVGRSGAPGVVKANFLKIHMYLVKFETSVPNVASPKMAGSPKHFNSSAVIADSHCAAHGQFAHVRPGVGGARASLEVVVALVQVHPAPV